MSNKKWLTEIIIATCILVFGIYVIAGSIPLLGKTPFNSPGLTPLILGIITTVLTIFLFIVLFNLRKKIEPEKENKDKEERELQGLRQKRMIITIIFILLYVALLGKIPYTILTFLFLCAFMLYFKSASLPKTILISLAITGGIFYVFGTLMRVPLP